MWHFSNLDEQVLFMSWSVSGSSVLENAAVEIFRSSSLPLYLICPSVSRSVSRPPHPHTLIPAAASWLGSPGKVLQPKFYPVRSPSPYLTKPSLTPPSAFESPHNLHQFTFTLTQNKNGYFLSATCTELFSVYF